MENKYFDIKTINRNIVDLIYFSPKSAVGQI